MAASATVIDGTAIGFQYLVLAPGVIFLAIIMVSSLVRCDRWQIINENQSIRIS